MCLLAGKKLVCSYAHACARVLTADFCVASIFLLERPVSIVCNQLFIACIVSILAFFLGINVAIPVCLNKCPAILVQKRNRKLRSCTGSSKRQLCLPNPQQFLLNGVLCLLCACLKRVMPSISLSLVIRSFHKGLCKGACSCLCLDHRLF